MPRDVELDEYIEMLEDKHAMKTCATCRYYERNDPDNGTCDRIGAGIWEQTPNGEACLPIDNDTYSKHGRGALQLYVSDTFGCVLHEDKGA